MHFISRGFLGVLLCSLFAGASPALAQESPLPGDLIKGANSSAVYYYYGHRYAFPNEDIYFTWYTDFSKVKTVSDEFLASIPLVANVRYRAGSRMIKIESDPKVYYLGRANTLRWIPTEADATLLYGTEWAKDVRDVSDALFIDYRLGEPLTAFEIQLGSQYLAGGSYLEFADVLVETRGSFPPASNFLSSLSFITASVRTADNHFSGTSTQSLLQTKNAVEGLHSMWTKTLDLPLQFASTTYGYSMTFSQNRGDTVAHRTVQVVDSGSLSFSATFSESTSTSSVAQGSGDVVLDYSEVIFPAAYPAYPNAATVAFRNDAQFQSHGMLVVPDREAIRTWYMSQAPAKGWVYVTERINPFIPSEIREQVGDFDNPFANVYEWVFRRADGKGWLVIRYTESAFFQILLGNISVLSSIMVTLP